MTQASEERKAQLEKMYDTKFTEEFKNVLRTRHPLIGLVCRDEERFVKFVESFCWCKNYEGYIWDCCNGLSDLTAMEKVNKEDPMDVLKHIQQEASVYQNRKEMVQEKINQGCNGIIYVLLDAFSHFGNPKFVRGLKNIAQTNSIVSVVVTGPYLVAAPTLNALMPTMECPGPTVEEYKDGFDLVTDGIKGMLPDLPQDMEDNEEELLKLVKNLTIPEVQRVISYSVVSRRKIDMELIAERIKKIEMS